MLSEATQFLNHPSGYLVFANANLFFSPNQENGFIAYREHGRHFFSFGGVHASASERPQLLDAFVDFAKQKKRRIVVVQLRQEQLELYRSRGFCVNRFGASYSLSLSQFTLSGTSRMKLRNKIKRARSAGIEVKELGADIARDGAIFGKLREVSASWLQEKHKPELEFMVGELGTPDNQNRRIFVATKDSDILGFITYVPSFGDRPGFLHDLTRRRREAPTGTMELINAAAIERFVREQIPWLHFGFTPFVVEDLPQAGENRVLSFVLRMLFRHGSFVYPARSQVEYKLKWRPEVVEPEYIAFAPLSLRAIYDLLRVTRSI